ncbi:uncharacterized protein LOC109594381 isoform X2 [Aethina tumida]|uniref:uncharacterized protein LOC109594381 isoform X2 n=1 Tax=Aethina tumida TaxID=116153 RepID=UPI002148DFE4|nr:uncharacterized protein LOC109594381 isoform X2 [Aethina tumida]
MPLKNNMGNFKFEPEWIQVLINLRMKHAKLFIKDRKSVSKGWKLIYEEMMEAGAPEHVSLSNIKKKWMNLMARYRQLKNSDVDPETITWPYFEQINKAFGSRFSTTEKTESFRKKDIINGKKFTAKYGWMTIRSLLHCEERYTILQLSKCWQNLIQRYKSLLKNGNTNNVTWPYFQIMHTCFKGARFLNTRVKKQEKENIKNELNGEFSYRKIKDQLNDIIIKQELVTRAIDELLQKSQILLDNINSKCSSNNR